MTSISFVWCTNEIEMIHHYPEAPVDVKFLSNPHRHMFKTKVEIEVTHNNRDIEFIQLKRDIDDMLKTFKSSHDGTSFSCEVLADKLYYWLENSYPDRKIAISVSEDGENGCHKLYGV